jgi:hypothetical protein
VLEFRTMISEDEQAKLRFELANANLQSVSRAQGIYLTALLIYICFVWAMYLTRSGEALTLRLAWLELRMDAVWKITPFITMVLTLAVAGTLNATVLAYAEVNDAGKALFGSRFGSLFEVDTHKNVIDYLALLQIFPWGRTRKLNESARQPILGRLRHLIFPALFLLSLGTSAWSVYQASYGPSPRVFMLIGGICLGFQILFSMRPMYRWFGRLFGAKQTDDVYN